MDDANPPKDTHTNESNNNKKYTVSPTTLSQLLLLPRPDIQFVEMFFSYAYSFIPIFHPPSFLESYASQDPCLCYALAALGLRYRKAVESSESNPGHAEAQHFYRTAKALLESQYRAPTLSTIQALVVLSVYAAVTCEGMEYMILQGITARIFLLLKLDRFNPTDSSLPPIERELRKRVFWLCFIHDRFAVCLGGVGPQIPDGHGHVPLPCPEHLWAVPGFNTYLDGSPLDRSTAGPNGTTNDTGGGRNTSFFHYLTHLASIIGKVGSLVAMEEQTGIRYDAEHAVLELALGDWYRFLPSQVRDPGEQFSAHWTAVLPHWTTAFLHIAYQGTHILLNRSRMSDTLTLRHLGPLAACRFTQTSFMASRSIAAICRIISDRGNPLFLYICRFSLFCRMQAAFVFRDIIITRLDPLWANEARADVNELLRGFMTEARYSENAAQFARQLQAELGQTMVGAP